MKYIAEFYNAETSRIIPREIEAESENEAYSKAIADSTLQEVVINIVIAG